jgi:hypothetical protein
MGEIVILFDKYDNLPAVARVSAPNTRPPSKMTPQIVVPVDIG